MKRARVAQLTAFKPNIINGYESIEGLSIHLSSIAGADIIGGATEETAAARALAAVELEVDLTSERLQWLVLL